MRLLLKAIFALVAISFCTFLLDIYLTYREDADDNERRMD